MDQKVRSGEELPLDRLTTFLKKTELVNTAIDELEVTQFSNGFSNLTYLLSVGDLQWVLRRPPHGAIKRGHDMSREYKVLSRLFKVFPQSPRAYVFCEDISVIGAPFYVMEHIHGIVLTAEEVLQRKISVLDFAQIAETWLDTFVALHRTDYPSVGLSDLGRPEGYVGRQISNWGKQYLKAKTQEIPTAEKVVKWLEEHQPHQYDHALIHNDYKYNNIVFSDEGWHELKAVLDWEMCTIGDPLMDLGTSLSYWLTPGDNQVLKQVIPESTTMYPGNYTRSELVHQYSIKSGREINNLTFYYAYGLFKLAVIVQQIYFRYHHGYTDDERFSKLDLATKVLIRSAWRAIQRDTIE